MSCRTKIYPSITDEDNKRVYLCTCWFEEIAQETILRGRQLNFGRISNMHALHDGRPQRFNFCTLKSKTTASNLMITRIPRFNMQIGTCRFCQNILTFSVSFFCLTSKFSPSLLPRDSIPNPTATIW